MYTIKQVPSKNQTPRDKTQPIAIVNHITAGSLKSVDSWFTSASNDNSSAHFCIGRNGEIHQYVPIEQRAWHAGLTKEAVQFATAPIIKKHTMNPNAYTVGIEHEGYEGHGIDGALTEEQFWASVWLHRYIRDYVINKYGRYIELTPNDVIGHFQVDPRRKPNCPGKNFPWQRLYKELAEAKKLTLNELEHRIKVKMNPDDTLAVFDAIQFRINDLREKYERGGKWKEAAKQKIETIMDFIKDEKLL